MTAATTPHPTLSLAPHVRACRCQDQIILLDLRHSRYIGVPAQRFAPLAEHVLGWPAPRTAPLQSPLTQADVTALAAPLLQRSLLCRASTPPADVMTCELAQQTLHTDASIPFGTATDSLWRAIRCALRATLRLRTQSLEAIAAHLSRRRQQRASARQPQDRQDLGQCVSTYLRLRPFLLTAQDHCLLDTLVLLDVLAKAHIFPTLVIGVATAPFAAHAWAQVGDLVVNDQHEHVRRYTPILVA